MTEYVYALHDFTPEHDDEIPFKSGERIEIIEKDDQYGDGWWQGRNLSGKVGLFPQSYTSANVPMDELLTPTPATLQPLQEENPEDLINAESPLPQPNLLVTDTVMAATLTDVQEAIEQLAVRRDTDTDAGRSFSFVSTQEAETEPEDENDGGGWHKDARKALAERAERENARKEREEAGANALYDFYPRKSSQAAPPIEVELSDESDIDDEDDHAIRNGTHDIHPHHHKYSASTSTAVVEPLPSQVVLATAPTLTTRRSQASLPTPTSPSPPEDITLVDPPTITTARPQTPVTATTRAFPTSQPSHLAQMAASLPSPATSSAGTGDPSGSASVKSNPSSGAYSSNAPSSNVLSSPTPAPAILATDSSLTTLPAQPLQPVVQPELVPAQSPTESTYPPLPVALPTTAPTQVVSQQHTYQPSAQPPLQQMQSPASATSEIMPLADPLRDLKRVHPSEWTVDQVVEWLKSKSVDDATCAKFIEHEITGDVLLELDVNILKEELNITAFGKRMRIANAIVELRRPASFSSEPHASLNGLGSAGGLAALGNGFVGNGTSGHDTSTVGGGPGSPYTSGNQRFDGMSIVSGENERLTFLKVPKSRPAQLALSSPSDGALHTTALSGPTELTLEEDGGVEDRGVQSESETPLPTSTSSGTFAKSRRFLGLSTESGSSHSRKSGDGGSIPGSPALKSDKSPSVEDHSFSKHMKGKRSIDGSTTSKGSDRLSFFGATLGKSRKPPPRYSVHETDTPAHVQDRSSRSLSRLYLSTSKKNGRPVTAPGGNVRLGGKERDEVKQNTYKDKDKDQSLLRKRHISTISQTSPLSTSLNASVRNGGIDATNETLQSINGKIVLQPGRSVLDQIGVPDHAGWLKKKGEKYNAWKLRYLVLRGPHLYYLRSNSRTETKIKGYINVQGYKIIADENTNPGKYGFRIVHDSEPLHYFSLEEQLPVREWMKALMKATIDRDYSKPVMSSCNIPTIPLTVAQAMNPAPRPPSPSQREATQKALRRENPNQLSSRDARVLMGLPASENGAAPQPNGDRVRLDSFFSLDVEKNEAVEQVPIPTQLSFPPARPSRDARSHVQRGDVDRTDTASEAELVAWANSMLPEQYQIYDLTTDLTSGLVLLRLAESIKGKPNEPPISDATFRGENNLDGMFKLFDFLLDNDIKMGSVSINDVKQGRRDKTVQLLKALRAWGEKRKMLRSNGRGVGQAGPWMAMEAGTINW